MTISEEIRLKKQRFAGYVIRMDMSRITTNEGERIVLRKYGLRKYWTEMGIEVEGKDNRGNKYTPTNIQELTDREGHRNRIKEQGERGNHARASRGKRKKEENMQPILFFRRGNRLL